MIISDLNYLEVVAEASNVVGGGYKKKDKPFKIKLGSIKIKNQSNTSVINQVAVSTSVAMTKDGDAIAVSEANNVANVVQINN